MRLRQLVGMIPLWYTFLIRVRLFRLLFLIKSTEERDADEQRKSSTHPTTTLLDLSNLALLTHHPKRRYTIEEIQLCHHH